MTRPKLAPITQWADASPQQLLDRIEAAGVAGLGGGGFPTARKLAAALAWREDRSKPGEQNRPALRLIGNAVACEPGIEADLFILQQEPADALLGLGIVAHLLGTPEVLLALNPRLSALHEELLAHWRALFEQKTITQPPTLQLREVPATAAAGAEALLIPELLGQPVSKPPAQQGVVVQNITTLWAVARGVVYGEALHRRPVTVGSETRWLDIGTAVADLDIAAQSPLRSGGLWSGTLIPDTGRIDHQTLGLHPLPESQATPCISCGHCQRACPVDLDPELLYRLFETLPTGPVTPATSSEPRSPINQLAAAGLADCLECGACNVVCPSRIDLLAGFRAGKTIWTDAQQANARAQRASERFERHSARLAQRAEQAEAARTERLRKRRDWAAGFSSQDTGD